MINLVLITSIIDTPNIPLSYYPTRSAYSISERFEQTKKTFETIREKIPNAKIFLVECSNLTEDQNDYFIKNSDYFLNLFYNHEKKECIYSISKALGEGTMTISALEYLKKNNILYDNFFKISGRYWLSENFLYENFLNENIIIHNIENNIHNTLTSLYKLHKKNINEFYEFLISNKEKMNQCIGYEVLFAIFLNIEKKNKVIHLEKIGVNGLIAVERDIFIDN